MTSFDIEGTSKIHSGVVKWPGRGNSVVWEVSHKLGGSAGGLLSCACDAQNEGSKPELWLAWSCWRTCSTTEDPLLLLSSS